MSNPISNPKTRFVQGLLEKGIIFQRIGFTLPEILVVISITFLLLSFLFPAVQSVRESARKTDCSNRLRNLAIAAIAFESSSGNLPSAVFDGIPTLENYGADRGLFLSVLPFLQQQNTLTGFIEDHPATAIENQSLLRSIPTVLTCPSSEFQGDLNDIAQRFSAEMTVGLQGLTCDYAGNGGFQGGWDASFEFHRGSVATVVKGINKPVKTSMIYGGQSNTFLFWESNGTWFKKAGTVGQISFNDGAPDSFVLVLDRPEGISSFRSRGKASTKSYTYNWTGKRTGLAAAYDQYGVSGDPKKHPDRFVKVINVATDQLQPFSPHPNGCHFAMVDGSIHFKLEIADSSILLDLATRE